MGGILSTTDNEGSHEGAQRYWLHLPFIVVHSVYVTGAVTCIKVRHNDQECVSASSDGTCIIWDLVLVYAIVKLY